MDQALPQSSYPIVSLFLLQMFTLVLDASLLQLREANLRTGYFLKQSSFGFDTSRQNKEINTFTEQTGR